MIHRRLHRLGCRMRKNGDIFWKVKADMSTHRVFPCTRKQLHLDDTEWADKLGTSIGTLRYGVVVAAHAMVEKGKNRGVQVTYLENMRTSSKLETRMEYAKLFFELYLEDKYLCATVQHYWQLARGATHWVEDPVFDPVKGI